MYEAEIAEGMAWLDRVHPGWELEVDVANLDQNDPCMCMLGQLEGGYYEALLTHEIPSEGEELGFYTKPEKNFAGWWVAKPEDWEILTDEWRTAIKQRLNAGVKL
jgi:hypothetical protein